MKKVKYFRSAYGEKPRSFLSSRTRISHLIDFGDAPVFTSIAYPSIIVLQKQDGAGGLSHRKQIESETGEESNIVKSLTWKPGPLFRNLWMFSKQNFVISNRKASLLNPGVLNRLNLCVYWKSYITRDNY
jgi:hypothetical protein